MLVGVVAFNVLRVIEPSEPRALGVLLTGYIFQGTWAHAHWHYHAYADNTVNEGLGFFMTFFYICIYIIRYATASIWSESR